jgi:hypothetical protein
MPSVISSLIILCGRLDGFERFENPFDEFTLAELPGADVHAEAEAVRITSRLANSEAVTRQASLMTQLPTSTIRPLSSSTSMNWAGERTPSTGMMPAQQDLGADHPGGARIDLWLKVQLEFVAL